MTKPTPKPTIASLQRELATTKKMFETARRNWMECGMLAGRRRLKLVAGNYRRLKKFVEGGNG